MVEMPPRSKEVEFEPLNPDHEDEEALTPMELTHDDQQYSVLSSSHFDWRYMFIVIPLAFLAFRVVVVDHSSSSATVTPPPDTRTDPTPTKRVSSLASTPNVGPSAPATVSPSSSESSRILQQQLEKCHSDPQEKCFMFSFKGSGLCSQLLGIFVANLYLEREYNYTTMLVDNTAYQGYHRHDDDTPVLTGYFTPGDVAVLNDAEHEGLWLAPLLPPSFGKLAYWNQLDSKHRKSKQFKSLVVNNNEPPYHDVVMVSHMMFHGAARKWVKSDDGMGGYRHLYNTLVRTTCPVLQFNDHAWQDIRAFRQQHFGLDDDDPGVPQPSVAFHVRRTDKLLGESEFFPASVYVDKLMQVIKRERNVASVTDIQFCFVATDDLSVPAEMQQALDEAGFTCRLTYYDPTLSSSSSSVSEALVHPGDPDRRYQTDAGLVFLSEFSVLLDTTYFVGTFGSNVGALAAVLRGCPDRHHGSGKNYAQSYGVDRPHWYFR